jgi:hypothetical protein
LDWSHVIQPFCCSLKVSQTNVSTGKESRLLKRLVGVVVCLLLCPAVDAESQYSFDLDVPAARVGFWAMDDLGSASKLEAELEIVELRRDSRWVPAFHVTLSSGDHGVALRLARDFGAPGVKASVVVTEKGKVVGQQALRKWTLQKSGRLRVVMDWSTPTTLVLMLDGQSADFPLSFVPKSLKVSASTGELKGHSLVLTPR